MAQILTLRKINEGIRARNLLAVITFIDFRNGFGSMNRRKMLQILKAYGIPKWLVDAGGITHKETQATCTNCNLLSPDSAETEFFKITTGVLQGYTLAPYLLVIVLDYVVREAIDGQEESLGLTKRQAKTRSQSLGRKSHWI